MTRVFCEYESCDYNAEGECMKCEITITNGDCEPACMDYEVTMND